MKIKNKFIKYLLPLFFSFLFYFFITPLSDYLLFILGLYLGLALLVLDEKLLFKYYVDNKQSVELATRSTIFMIVLIPLAIFVLTSTGSAIASGLIIGIILSLVFEMREYKTDAEKFKNRFFYQLKMPLSTDVVLKIYYGAIGTLLVLSALLVI